MMTSKWIVPILCVVAALAVSLYGYYAIEGDVMVTHFGPDGEPDNRMNKLIGLLIMPVIMLLVPAANNVSIRLEPNPSKRERMSRNIGAISTGTAVFLLAIHVLFVIYNQGIDVSFDRIVPVFVGLLFIIFGNITPRLPQGSMNLPKVPEAAYRMLAVRIGRLMVAAGVVIALTVLLPSAWNLTASIGVTLISVLAVVAMTLYSAKKG